MKPSAWGVGFGKGIIDVYVKERSATNHRNNLHAGILSQPVETRPAPPVVVPLYTLDEIVRAMREEGARRGDGQTQHRIAALETVARWLESQKETER